MYNNNEHQIPRPPPYRQDALQGSADTTIETSFELTRASVRAKLGGKIKPEFEKRRMRKADKKSRIYYRKLRLGDNIERFVEEKKRKM